MWPRDAFVGQHVVALVTLSRWESFVEKGKVYTIGDIQPHPVLFDSIYMRLSEVTGPAPWVRSDLLRPLDKSRLDVFRRMLHHADA